MMRFSSLVIFLFGLVATTMASDIEFKVGQEWTYAAREVDKGSTLIVGALEDDGSVIHILVRRVKVINPHSEGGIAEEIGHIPISASSLRESVRRLVGTDSDTTGIREGIEAWRVANGGVFSISVAAAVQYIEETLSGGEIIDE